MRIAPALFVTGLSAVGLLVGSPAAPVAAAGTPMTITIDLGIDATGRTIRLPLDNGGDPTEFVVDWDVTNNSPACPDQIVTVTGGLDALIDRNVSCTYLLNEPPVKTISITPTGNNTIHRFGFDAPTLGATKFTGVTAWGDLSLVSLNGAFRGMTNLTAVPGTLPGTVTSLDMTFSGATSFNGAGVVTWNTQAVTSMYATFQDAHAFNQPVGGWNTSNVTSMMAMFADARAFDRPIGGWNTSNVTNMMGMFSNAWVFDQDLSQWDVGNVTGFPWMFSQAYAFNGDVSTWDTGSATTMRDMFFQADSFNQSLNSWNVANVTNTSNMFRFTDVFNNGAAPGACSQFHWADSTSLTTTEGMFASASAFNGEVVLDTADVTSMTEMFLMAPAFNNGCAASLALDTSNVTAFDRMFYGAATFDRDISTWNVRQATDMDEMFRLAMDFEQDLSAWCFEGPVTRVDFADSAPFENQPAKHPSWAACPPPFVFAPQPVVTTPPTTPPSTTQPPAIGDGPGSDSTSPPATLPVTGNQNSDLLGVGLVALVFACLVHASRRTFHSPR